jgi:hypothetical protein
MGIPSRVKISGLPLKTFTHWNTERPEESIKGLKKEIGSTKCGQSFPELIVKKYTYQFPKSTEK